MVLVLASLAGCEEQGHAWRTPRVVDIVAHPDIPLELRIHATPSSLLPESFLNTIRDRAVQLKGSNVVVTLERDVPETNKTWDLMALQELDRRLEPELPETMEARKAWSTPLRLYFVRGQLAANARGESYVVINQPILAVREPEMGPLGKDERPFLAIHELGHAFGLVGCGAPVTRERRAADSPCHSANQESVMSVYRDKWDVFYREYGIEPHVTHFDPDDIADVRALQKAVVEQYGTNPRS